MTFAHLTTWKCSVKKRNVCHLSYAIWIDSFFFFLSVKAEKEEEIRGREKKWEEERKKMRGREKKENGKGKGKKKRNGSDSFSKFKKEFAIFPDLKTDHSICLRMKIF